MAPKILCTSLYGLESLCKDMMKIVAIVYIVSKPYRNYYFILVISLQMVLGAFCGINLISSKRHRKLDFFQYTKLSIFVNKMNVCKLNVCVYLD